jgi:hypothetical protein
MASWSLTSLRSLIVRRLQGEANARVALSSLAPVGEEPSSSHPVQSRLNDLIVTYNGIIREVASIAPTDFIPFFEAFQQRLARTTRTNAFTRFSFPSFYRDYLLREDPAAKLR